MNEKKVASVRISERIVENGYVPSQHMATFLKFHPVLIGGRRTLAQHPDYTTVVNHITKISKVFSKTKNSTTGVTPKLRKGDRTNLYTPEDYKKFGDKILKEYFQENPYDKWDVVSAWDIPEENMFYEH